MTIQPPGEQDEDLRALAGCVGRVVEVQGCARGTRRRGRVVAVDPHSRR